MAAKIVVKTLNRGSTRATLSCSICKGKFTQDSLGQHIVDIHERGNGLILRLEEQREARKLEMAENTPAVSKNQRKRLLKEGWKIAAKDWKKIKYLRQLGLPPDMAYFN